MTTPKDHLKLTEGNKSVSKSLMITIKSDNYLNFTNMGHLSNSQSLSYKIMSANVGKGGIEQFR